VVRSSEKNRNQAGDGNENSLFLTGGEDKKNYSQYQFVERYLKKN
jgi:hypothetical protein